MIRAIIASIAVAAACTAAYARPVFNKLNLSPVAASPSQDRASGLAYRSADDFVMTGAQPGTTALTTVEAVMVGRGTAGLLPSQSKFGLTIYSNAFGNKPGNAIYTKLGAYTVTDLGALPSGSRKYKVTFSIPVGSIWVVNNQRYWLSVYGRLDDANTWNFAKNGGATWGSQLWFKPNSGNWFAAPASEGDRSFRVTGY